MEKLIEAIKQGRILLVGECRGSRVEVMRYVNKKTGQAAAFTSTTYLVERAGLVESVMITQQLGDGVVDVSTVKVSAQKGKTYAFELSAWKRFAECSKRVCLPGLNPCPCNEGSRPGCAPQARARPQPC